VRVSTRARDALDRPSGLLDLFVVQPSQRQLRCVEGHSIRAVDSGGGTEGD
jgi:hypothetical protein